MKKSFLSFKTIISTHPLLYNYIQNKRMRWRLFLEIFNEMKRVFQYAGTIDEFYSLNSLETQILLRTHCIEKGLSLRAPRKGFGQKNILNLLQYMERYKEQKGSETFLNDQCDVIETYIDYHSDAPELISAVSSRYDLFVKTIKRRQKSTGGVISFSADDVIKARSGNFEQFASSRHSMRFFDNSNIVIEDAIKQALCLAQCAPSACNRQPQHVYHFTGEAKNEMIKYQQGANAFSEEIDSLLLVTARQSRYCLDIHQPYIDGGLYAMNLLYSLHYYGLATIPLSSGMISSKQKKVICRKWNIPDEEVFVLFIAVGGFPKNCRSNLSKRHSFEDVYRKIY